MPNAVGIKQFLAPSKGLITEQTPLSPVEGSTIDETNMDFSPSMAVRRRRKGLNLELGGNPIILNEAFQAGDVVDHFYWPAVNGDGDVNFHVFQIGRYLYFLDDQDTPVSDGTIGQVFNLDQLLSSQTAETTARQVNFDFASGKGVLLIVSNETEPGYLAWDADTSTISVTPFTLLIRDLVGVDDGLSTDERPTTLSDEHGYNLRNQTWDGERKRKSDNLSVDPITQFSQDIPGQYPSNADIAYLAMIDNGSGKIRFWADEGLEDLFLGNTPAPKGHFIVDAFNIRYNELYLGTDPTIPDAHGAFAQFFAALFFPNYGELDDDNDTSGSDDEDQGGGSTPIFGEPGGGQEA